MFIIVALKLFVKLPASTIDQSNRNHIPPGKEPVQLTNASTLVVANAMAMGGTTASRGKKIIIMINDRRILFSTSEFLTQHFEIFP